MNKKDQAKLDKAMRAMLTMGEVPEHEPPKFTPKDLKRKFKMKVNSSGKGKIEEVQNGFVN